MSDANPDNERAREIAREVAAQCGIPPREFGDNPARILGAYLEAHGHTTDTVEIRRLVRLCDEMVPVTPRVLLRAQPGKHTKQPFPQEVKDELAWCRGALTQYRHLCPRGTKARRLLRNTITAAGAALATRDGEKLRKALARVKGARRHYIKIMTDENNETNQEDEEVDIFDAPVKCNRCAWLGRESECPGWSEALAGVDQNLMCPKCINEGGTEQGPREPVEVLI